MEAARIRGEERTGLIVAVGLHVALLAILATQALKEAPAFKPVERMTVSLAEDVGLEATAPDPVPESRAAIAPTLSDTPAPAPVPEILEAPSEPVVVRPAPRVQPRTPTPARAAPRRETPRERPQPQPRTAERGGGSRIGSDFLAGSGDSTTTNETRTPASQIGAAEVASIQQALARQVKPHWTAPQGVDADLLVTLLDFDLNADGSLRGRPRVRSQSGDNDSNRPQKALHAERAIKAVQLAAPFKLDPKLYEAWKSIRGARFDRNLSK